MKWRVLSDPWADACCHHKTSIKGCTLLIPSDCKPRACKFQVLGGRRDIPHSAHTNPPQCSATLETTASQSWSPSLILRPAAFICQTPQTASHWKGALNTYLPALWVTAGSLALEVGRSWEEQGTVTSRYLGSGFWWGHHTPSLTNHPPDSRESDTLLCSPLDKAGVWRELQVPLHPSNLLVLPLNFYKTNQKN